MAWHRASASASDDRGNRRRLVSWAQRLVLGGKAFSNVDARNDRNRALPEILHVPAQFCIILRFEFWQGPLGQESHEKLVPTERIELSTSPLPRGCSTAELCGRQRLGNSAGPCQKSIAVQDRHMAKGGGKSGTEKRSATGPSERQSRQSAALRENLRRRKQQSRQRSDTGGAAVAPKKIRPS